MTTPLLSEPITIVDGDRSASIENPVVNLARQAVRRNRFGPAICRMMADLSVWEGTASELLRELQRLHPGDRRLGRQTPAGLGQHVNKLQSALSDAGCVRVETDRVGHNRTRMIYLTTVDAKACAEAAVEAQVKRTRAADGDVEHALGLAIASVVR